MDDIRKILQAILSGQNALKQELSVKIDKVDQKVDSLREEVHVFQEDITKRVDRLGKSLAYLEDDAPTREEFDKLEDRVVKVEQKTFIKNTN